MVDSDFVIVIIKLKSMCDCCFSICEKHEETMMMQLLNFRGFYQSGSGQELLTVLLKKSLRYSIMILIDIVYPLTL